MTTYAVTVLGRDRPGIVAEATGLLAGLGLNLEDTTMTLLRGHFAMTLVCAGAVDAAQLDTALEPLRSGGGLAVSVSEVTGAGPSATPGTPWVLTVHGGDRPGIVSRVTRLVADVRGNVTDLTTRLTSGPAGDLYLLVAELELPREVDPQAVQASIAEVADRMGVTATLRAADVDEL